MEMKMRGKKSLHFRIINRILQGSEFRTDDNLPIITTSGRLKPSTGHPKKSTEK
jgi:hypothetical protein